MKPQASPNRSAQPDLFLVELKSIIDPRHPLVSLAQHIGWEKLEKALHGAPYDGHTLNDALEQVKRLTGHTPEEAYVDLGYRGHGVEGETKVHVVPRKLKHLPRNVRKWMKQRAAIEPKIGHLKSDNRMERNRLKGQLGDQLNAILSACGSNLRKLLRAFFCPDWGETFLSLLFIPQPRFTSLA
jgi:hypothetical protein